MIIWRFSLFGERAQFGAPLLHVVDWDSRGQAFQTFGACAQTAKFGLWDFSIDILSWTNIAMENHHVQWENPLFLWPFSIAMLVHQKVSTWYSTMFHHFSMFFLRLLVLWWLQHGRIACLMPRQGFGLQPAGPEGKCPTSVGGADEWLGCCPSHIYPTWLYME